MQCNEVEVVLEQHGWTPLPDAARAHVAQCSSCRSLVEDLSAIVAAAHLLPAEVEAPARVWLSLRAQLESEGLIKSPAGAWYHSWWGGFSDLFGTRVLATSAVGLLTVAAALLLQMQGPGSHPTESRNAYADIAVALNSDEAHLPPAQFAKASVVDLSLRQNLDIVDNFIADCERRMQENPQDDLAREYLSGAYQQKAELLSALMERGGSGY